MRILVKKIAETPDCQYKAVDAAEYKYGQLNSGSVPIEYTVEGILIGGITVGKPVYIDRHKRNGIEVRGVFASSPVREVGSEYFKTANSVYYYQFLDNQNN